MNFDWSKPRTARRLRCHLAVATTLLVAKALALGAEELVTDRPDFTESATVVSHGSVQIESGGSWVDAGGQEIALSGPELLVRWGLGGRFELRIGWPDYAASENGPSGLGDGSIGAKWQLGPTAGGWDLGVIGTLSLPTGDPAVTSGRVDPQFILALGRGLADGWSLGAQVSVTQQTDGTGSRRSPGATMVLGRALTERTATFLELAAERAEGGVSVLAHHGYTIVRRGRFQIDVHVGWGLADPAPRRLAGAGLSWRR